MTPDIIQIVYTLNTHSQKHSHTQIHTLTHTHSHTKKETFLFSSLTLRPLYTDAFVNQRPYNLVTFRNTASRPESRRHNVSSDVMLLPSEIPDTALSRTQPNPLTAMKQ